MSKAMIRAMEETIDAARVDHGCAMFYVRVPILAYFPEDNVLDGFIEVKTRRGEFTVSACSIYFEDGQFEIRDCDIDDIVTLEETIPDLEKKLEEEWDLRRP